MGKTANSIASLKDIVKNETVKSPSCTTGFTHSPSGYTVSFYNGSEITSLNGNPDSNRSKRATMVFFDEVGFMDENAIMVTEAFASQDSNFKTSIDDSFNYKTLRRRCPTQLVYASSASDVNTTFWKYYKEFYINMIIGSRDYFCCDISCEVPLSPTMDGEEYPPLLTQAKIDKAMKNNSTKALREYYNKFTIDGGEDQLIKRANIIRNESFLLPELGYTNDKGEEIRYGICFDPARTGDNSIILVMKYINSKDIGWYGEVVYCVNLLDQNSKNGYKLKSTEQIKELRRIILAFNGKFPDYENIDLLIDAGAGGGGITAYADPLLEDWKDDRGNTHKGFIDVNYDVYQGEISKYPNASRNLTLVSPNKYRNQMCEELLELMILDLIKFPKEYDNKGYVSVEYVEKNESKIKHRQLTTEEEVILINLDIMKTEITSIYKFKNADGIVNRYALPKDKERKMHDDRFYCMLLAAHRLYELRRNDKLKVDVDPYEDSQLVWY